jgi:hypothetical protein
MQIEDRALLGTGVRFGRLKPCIYWLERRDALRGGETRRMFVLEAFCRRATFVPRPIA